MDFATRYNTSEFGRRFPQSKFHDDGRACATWFLGNDYRNASPYYGAYPPMYWKRIQAFMRPEETIVHLFSGSLPKGNYIRVDVDETLDPEICCRTEEVDTRIPHNSVDSVFADPPYTKEDSDIGYKGNFPNKKKTLHSVYRILKPGGLVFWLDTSMPMFRKTEFEIVGVITILISTNHRVRAVFIFRKRSNEAVD
jgi:hypothetical protein